MLESTIDAAEWKLEVERVLPMLKVHIRGDNKVGYRGVQPRVLSARGGAVSGDKTLDTNYEVGGQLDL